MMLKRPLAPAFAGALCIAFSAGALAAPQPAPPSNLCIDETGNCASVPVPPRDGIKWHPGHYMLTPSVNQIVVSQFMELATEPNIAGVQHRYSWAQLEPTKGNYDFSIIESNLAVLRGLRKQLVIQVLDRRFGSSNPVGYIPQYILNDPEYHGGAVPNGAGVRARVWEEPVMDRLIALYRALGKRFNDDPNVEGVIVSETSGFAPMPAGFTRPALATQIKRLISATRTAWPNTNVFAFTNFLSGELEGIMAHCYANRCGLGGPDVLPPPHGGAEGDRILKGLVGNVDYRGKAVIGYAVQTPELCGKEGCHQPDELLNYAVSQLGTTHIFWVRFGTVKDTATAKYSWEHGMLPAIRRTQGRINSACPTSFQGRCVSDPKAILELLSAR